MFQCQLKLCKSFRDNFCERDTLKTDCQVDIVAHDKRELNFELFLLKKIIALQITAGSVRKVL